MPQSITVPSGVLAVDRGEPVPLVGYGFCRHRLEHAVMQAGATAQDELLPVNAQYASHDAAALEAQLGARFHLFRREGDNPIVLAQHRAHAPYSGHLAPPCKDVYF